MTEGKQTEFAGTIGRTYRESTPHWTKAAQPAQGSPNIVFIVLDDVGFSDIGCYGSEISTPTIDSLAHGGVRYNNFHVTAMCSPTRACVLTGRNAHSVGVGIIADFSNGYPGYEGRITPSAATIPEVLRDYGYGTYAIGKWHLTNMDDYGAAGPHDTWPLGRGFSRWYGFHGGLTDQCHPELFCDNHQVNVPERPDYHLSEDLVDQAIGNIRDHVTSAKIRPFFLYLAFGACHFPQQVPKRFMNKYKGRYQAGWDVIRAERLKRQKLLGIVPLDTQLAPRNPGVEPWMEVAPRVRVLSERYQEAYAAFLDHTDAQIKRLVDYLKAIDQYENTLIVLLSDNGASDEGGPNGAFNCRKHMVFAPETVETGLQNIEKIGSEFAFNHYPAGWAQVSNTPLKWYKKGNHGGGIRAPLIMHWPKRLRMADQIRSQYHHAIDIAPTVYELLGLETPANYRGAPQMPIHGISAVYTFDAADEPTRKVTQYSELLGDRAIWHRGWKAVVRHSKGDDFDADRWELYHLERDFSEGNDLAQAHPEKLEEMIQLWWAEARKFGVLPLDDRGWERVSQRLRMKSADDFTFYPDMARLDRLSAPDISERSYEIRADVDIPAHGAEGVLLAWGSRFGGMALYVLSGRPHFEYVYSETTSHVLEGAKALTPGSHCISISYDRTSKSSGVVALFVDNECIDRGMIPETWPVFGIVGGITCGADDGGPPVTGRYDRPFRFTGTLHKVTVALGTGDDSCDQELARTLLREQ